MAILECRRPRRGRRQLQLRHWYVCNGLSLALLVWHPSLLTDSYLQCRWHTALPRSTRRPEGSAFCRSLVACPFHGLHSSSGWQENRITCDRRVLTPTGLNWFQPVSTWKPVSTSTHQQTCRTPAFHCYCSPKSSCSCCSPSSTSCWSLVPPSSCSPGSSSSPSSSCSSSCS